MIEQLTAAAANYTPLPQAETRRLIRRAQAGGRGAAAAREQLITANVRLVLHQAARYGAQTDPFWAEYVQEGLIGLHTAIDHFDLERGIRFSTYATYWVRSRIQRWMRCHAATIKIPVWLFDANSKVARLEAQMMAEGGGGLDDDALAERAGMRAATIARVRHARRITTEPLEEPGADDRAWLDTLAAGVDMPESDAPRITAAQMTAHIRAVVKSARNADLLIERMGIGLPRPRSVAECAAKYKLTPERVDSIVGAAMQSLRRPASRIALAAMIGETYE